MTLARLHESVAPSRNDPRRPAHDSTIADAVRDGLLRDQKRLPPWLLYDTEGSRLYELITELPEYYPSRTERTILANYTRDIAERATTGSDEEVSVVELGAGTATKTQLVLAAMVARQGRCIYVPVDVSPSPLFEARTRIEAALPGVGVLPIVGKHEAAFDTMRVLGRQLVIFIGSSIGNLSADEANTLLCGVRLHLQPGSGLLLGTDLRKSSATLVPAYDDARGVTAAFNKNVLVRINHELGGQFDIETIRHVALWNEAASRIEMHLESTVDQTVAIDLLGVDVHLGRGERIHTESSQKYDVCRVDALLRRAGFAREQTYKDDEGLFAVTFARAI
jgi:L-histidine N-alpha-methyltransferase